MVTITAVPPNPAPPKLTAHAPVPDLHSHFMAFMNANNKKGFLADEVSPNAISSVGNILNAVTENKRVSISQMAIAADEIVKITVRSITYNDALDIMAHMLGYGRWSALHKCTSIDGYAHNYFYGQSKEVIAKTIINQKDKEKKSLHQPIVDIPRLVNPYSLPKKKQIITPIPSFLQKDKS